MSLIFSARSQRKLAGWWPGRTLTAVVVLRNIVVPRGTRLDPASCSSPVSYDRGDVVRIPLDIATTLAAQGDVAILTVDEFTAVDAARRLVQDPIAALNAYRNPPPAPVGCPPFDPPVPYATQTIDFAGAQDLSLGDPAVLGATTQMTIVIWWRRENTGWYSGNAGLIAKNASAQRMFDFRALSEGGSGQFQIGFGNGASLVNGFIPDQTMRARWWYCLAVSYNAGTVVCMLNGQVVALTGSPSFPTSLPNTTSALTIGASAVGANRLQPAQVANIGIWASTALTEAQMRACWAQDELVDYREIPGLPAPSLYIPGNVSPPVEVMQGTPITGASGVSAQVPSPRITVDEVFSRRFVLSFGTNPGEPWITAAARNYGASPDVVRLADGRLLYVISRGPEHSSDHDGFYGYSIDDGLTWPISQLDYPGDGQNLPELAFNHGTLTDANSTRRNHTITLIPGIGAGGADRVICIFGETQISNPSRRVWSTYSDDGGATWSVPSECNLPAGVTFRAVGRSRVVVRGNGDGSLLASYYWQDVGVGLRYTAATMRSTDGGATWSHFSTILQDTVGVNGAQWEEPHLIYLNGQLVAFVRVDNGSPTYPFSRDVVRVVSADHGVTWSAPVFAYSGWCSPSMLYRPSDNLLVTITRHDPGAPDSSTAWGELIISRDYGVTWSDPVRLPGVPDERFMQGAGFLTQDNRIGLIWAHDCTTLTSSKVEVGIVRDCYLEQMG